MRVSELIEYVQMVMPSEIEDITYINWINEMESSIFQDVISKSPLNEEFDIEHKVEPVNKTINNTDAELELLDFGYRWVQLYHNYLFLKTCIVLEEFAKANNYISLYNNTLDDFVRFYFTNMVNSTRDARIKEWR